jgi:phosphorylcholine metabolism protein LicD
VKILKARKENKMKKIIIWVFVLVMSLSLVGCVDYGKVEAVKAQETMAEKVEEDKFSALNDQIETLEATNSSLSSDVETLKDENDQYILDNATLSEQLLEKDGEIKKIKDNDTKIRDQYSFELEKSDVFMDVLYNDAIAGKKTEFFFAHVMRVDFDTMDGTKITFDRLDKKIKDWDINVFNANDIDIEKYYDDAQYLNRYKSREKKQVASAAYIRVAGIEHAKFSSDVAHAMANVVYVTKDELETFEHDWYIDEKTVKTDENGKPVEQKNIYILCIQDDVIKMIIERG